MALLEVNDLSVVFARKGERPVRAVDGVSFTVDAGEVVGLVGESGCGKSVTVARAHGSAARQRGVRVGGKAELRRHEPARARPADACATCAAATSR